MVGAKAQEVHMQGMEGDLSVRVISAAARQAWAEALFQLLLPILYLHPFYSASLNLVLGIQKESGGFSLFTFS